MQNVIAGIGLVSESNDGGSINNTNSNSNRHGKL